MRLGRKTCPHPTLPATEIEQLVVDELRRYCKRPDVKRAVRALTGSLSSVHPV
jgi:hypothetical protein